MSMRWIVDTSAWSRRDLPEVNAQLNDILSEHGDSVFVLSPAVLLELLRGPQNDEVAVERKTLTEIMELLPTDAKTFELAADAMEVLATHNAEARLPLSDLITAALAHQHGCGVIHLDEDFEQLAQHSGLSFDQRRIALPGEDPEGGSWSSRGGQAARTQARARSPAAPEAGFRG